MKRKEFIETCSGLSRSELLEIAVNARKNVEKMISEDTKAMFHRLDEETVVEERYFETGWGKTHVYVVRSLNHKDEKLPVVVNAHGGGWTLEHSERDLYFCRRMAYLAGCVVFDIDYKYIFIVQNRICRILCCSIEIIFYNSRARFFAYIYLIYNVLPTIAHFQTNMILFI